MQLSSRRAFPKVCRFRWVFERHPKLRSGQMRSGTNLAHVRSLHKLRKRPAREYFDSEKSLRSVKIADKYFSPRP